MALLKAPILASRRARRLAALCQLSIFGLQVIFPAIVRVTAGRRDPFVRTWAAEALNIQLCWVVPFVVLANLAAGTQSDIIGYTTLDWVVMADPDDNEFCVLSPR